MIWDIVGRKLSTIVEINFPANVNIKLKISGKDNTYGELLTSLQLI